MPINRWWEQDPDEIIWIEITGKDDIGADLNTAQVNDDGKSFWGYFMINEIKINDIILHYDKKQQAIVAYSIANSPSFEDEVIWAARGTTARRKTVHPYRRPGWRLKLRDFHTLNTPIALDDFRSHQNDIRTIQNKLKKNTEGPIYFPFELSKKPSNDYPLKMFQTYLTKLPKDIIGLFPSLQSTIREVQEDIKKKRNEVNTSQITETQSEPTNNTDHPQGKRTLKSSDLKDMPLACIPEQDLQNAIKEIQQHLLIDEKIIRRIYRALLAGNVILTGPPGTGKTVLARLLPEIIWGRNGSQTAYATYLATATDEWSVHTLISGIEPQSTGGNVTYHVQYGHLTETIRKNWAEDPADPYLWAGKRTSVCAPSQVTTGQVTRGETQEFRGIWLVIDEFNRAPIDLALGSAMTPLSGGSAEALNVYTNRGYKQLPIPKDFRIIGTLNNFDRNYLNRTSEALKRRFSFINLLPPTRQYYEEEQAIVLLQALERCKHLSGQLEQHSSGLCIYTWSSVLNIKKRESFYAIEWLDPDHAFRKIFNLGWHLFEAIRVYRQLGTAQAISFIQQVLIAGLTTKFTDYEEWREALDEALCDTIADQLQILMPDELNTIYQYIISKNQGNFINFYQRQIKELYNTNERRFLSQLDALGSVVNRKGEILLREEVIRSLEEDNNPSIDEELLSQIFLLEETSNTSLPLFAQRLKALKTERG